MSRCLKSGVSSVVFTLLLSISGSPAIGEEKLTWQKSTKFTDSDLLPLKNEIPLVRNGKPVVAALIPETSEARKALAPALALLEAAWGGEIARVKEPAAVEPGMVFLIFGESSGTLSRRLKANWLAQGSEGYEVRGIPNALDLQRGIVYFGGRTEAGILEGVREFCAKYKVENGSLAVPAFGLVSVPAGGTKATVDPATALSDIRELYKKLPSDSNSAGIRLLTVIARDYYRTGDERLAKTFMEMLHVFDEGYEQAKAYAWQKPPPTFLFHELPKACDLVEESPSLTDTDRLFCGETVRRITEECMNYWEMKEPMDLYNEGKTAYLHNHPLFCSHSVNCAARWLKSRFRLPAADYWLAASAQPFRGMTKAVLGPEDAGTYQFISPRLFIEFCMESGQMEYKTPNLRKHIDYAMCLIDERGWMTSFGDTPPMFKTHSLPFVKLGYEIYDDQLCAWLLKYRQGASKSGTASLPDLPLPENPQPGDRLLGLTVFEFDPFLKQLFKLKSYFQDFPGLNKAVFRSGWGDNEQYLLLSGENVIGWHGHFDANAIVQFAEGDRYWLVDGDYVRAFPRHHNSLEVCRDGEAPDLRRGADRTRSDTVAELLGSASHPSHQQAITVSRLRDYGGLDWTRRIFWDKDAGVGIIDTLEAKTPGRYLTRLSLRTLGELEGTNGVFTVTQKPSEKTPKNLMYVRKADDSESGRWEQFDHGHGGPFGYYDAYEYSGPVTKVITSSRRSSLAAGQTQGYANFLQTAQTKDVPPVFMSLTENSWKLEGREPALLVTGKFSSGGINIDADAVYLTGKRLTACGARHIEIAGVKWTGTEAAFTAEFKGEGQGLSALASEKVTAAIKVLSPAGSPAVKVASEESAPGSKDDIKEIAPSVTIDAGAVVTALAAHENLVALGLENGLVGLYRSTGEKLWQAGLGTPVTALAPVKVAGKTCWAAGTRYIDRNSQTGLVALISEAGEVLWKKEVPPFRERPGTVRCITAAQLKAGADQQIVAGSEAWRYYTFDTNGEMLWTNIIDHAATVVKAADFDNDGLDEILAGSEYAQSWLIDSDGKLIRKTYSSPGDWSVAGGDLTGDGKLTGVVGREDCFIKAVRFVPSKQEQGFYWECNVGGLPTGIFFLPEGSLGRLAVSTDQGTVIFVDRSGQRTGITELPDALDASAFDGEMISALCRDGRIYHITLSGKTVSKSIVLPVPSEAQKQLIAGLSGGNTAVARAGKILIFNHRTK